MRSKRILAVGAVIASLSLAATACGGTPEAEDEGSSNEKTSLNLGWNQPFYSYNENTSNGNATANNVIKYLMNGSFWYVSAPGELKADTSFGTYEKTSDDPLTVKYTVSKDAKWSDGTPYDAADLPAHVIAAKALGISDPTKAKDAVIKAITDKDDASLSKIANF
ncbi:MAG: hypothetical protein ABWX73_05230, partial [Marmoricola sp.]